MYGHDYYKEGDEVTIKCIRMWVEKYEMLSRNTKYSLVYNVNIAVAFKLMVKLTFAAKCMLLSGHI